MLKKYRIWWSPMGCKNNNSEVIDAVSMEDAKAQAYDRMKEVSRMGAYGAEPLGHDLRLTASKASRCHKMRESAFSRRIGGDDG